MTTALSVLSSTTMALTPHGPTWMDGACPTKTQNKDDLDLYKMAGLWFEYVWEDNFSAGMDHYVCSSFIMLDEGDGTHVVYNSFMWPVEEELWAMEMNEREKKGLPDPTDEELRELYGLDEGEEFDREKESFNPADFQRDSGFIAYKMHWKQKQEGEGQKAQATFMRTLDDTPENIGEREPTWNKTMQIIDTDYHSYATGLHCEERTNPESGAVEHAEDYFVLTREKQPSMYMRKRARDALVKEGLSDERIKEMNKGKIFDCWGKDFHQ